MKLTQAKRHDGRMENYPSRPDQEGGEGQDDQARRRHRRGLRRLESPNLKDLIDVDLPWNPSRLEQRIGRIKRFGQRRDKVDMANLVYHGTVGGKVYETLSS